MKNPINKLLFPTRFLGFGRKVISMACICQNEDGSLNIASKEVRPHRAVDEHPVYSVSKSVVAIALGMLYDEGKIKPSDKIADYFSDYFPEDVDPKWYEVTLENLLHHRIGAQKDFDFDAENANVVLDKDDYLYSFFRYKLPRTIGKDMMYSDGNYYVLARVVEKVSGENPEKFLRSRLFEPLDFYYYAWAKDKNEHVYGGSGLFLRTEDLVKLGWLWQHKGVYNGKRYISEDWCNKAMTLLGERKPGDRIYGYGIGYVRKDVFCITGAKGQGIFYNIHKNVAYAWNSCAGNYLMGIAGILDFLNLI